MLKMTLVNYSTISDEDVQVVVRAVNTQLRDDFALYWDREAELRLGGKATGRFDPASPVELRGDAILYLLDDPNDPQLAGILGYHDENAQGVPYGFVFTEISERLGESWSVTLSHEALELVADAQANELVAGPDPRDPNNLVFFWFEVCDAVQAESYDIDGVPVSNFVTPLYFTLGEQEAGRNDFLARPHNGQTLPSFGVNPGGYVGFFDPADGTVTYPADELARQRLEIKLEARLTRRALRYSALQQRVKMRDDILLPDK